MNHLDPLTVGLGRAVVASVIALFALVLSRARWPSRRSLPSLMLVAATVVIGFPVLSAFALQDVPASRGAVVLAIAPLATALFSTLRNGERPGVTFWLTSCVGSGAVLAYVATTGGGFGPSDLKLVLASVIVGIGYAEGARLSKAQPGWQVIAWALVLAAPVLVWVTPWPATLEAVPTSAKVGFAYVSVISMFLGFVAWYSGLASGGIAKMGQLQLLQPFLTLLWSALLLGESLPPTAWWAASVVVLCIAVQMRRPTAAKAPVVPRCESCQAFLR